MFEGVVVRVSKIQGNSENGLTGSEIDYFLAQCKIEDVTLGLSK